MDSLSLEPIHDKGSDDVLIKRTSELGWGGVIDDWFAFADSDGDGRITGHDAVSFFTRSGLPKDVLAKVWALADHGRRGYLDKRAFAKALFLISLAQSSDGDISNEAYSRAMQRGGEGLELPMMEGMDGLQRRSRDSEFTAPADTTFTHGGVARPSAAQPSQPTSTQTFMAPIPSSKDLRKVKKIPKQVPMHVITSITDGLRAIYFQKVKPLEDLYKFHAFFGESLKDGDFDAKPLVLLLGAYSTGKTTFIEHLLGRQYPGCHIGPEPTTDRFVVVMSGEQDRTTPGNTLAVQPDKLFQGLQSFGTGFLGRLMGSQCRSKLLEEVTIVDTPGVLSGKKQIEREYRFHEAVSWFASRADVILLMFDPYKLDVSDEYMQIIQMLHPHNDKIRVVLNKADQVGAQEMMRVYGAMMWQLGKVFRTPEVCRVYIGSFNAQRTVRECELKGLFEAEQDALLKDLLSIPQKSGDRKVNEFVKRVRAAQIHIAVASSLRKQLPVFGKQKAQAKLLANLDAEFLKVQRAFRLPAGDFPDPYRYRELTSAFDLQADFPKPNPTHIQIMEDVLTNDIPQLLKAFDNPF